MLHYIAPVALSLLAVKGYTLDVYEWTLDVNTASRHSSSTYTFNGDSKSYNEDNDGFGLTYGFSETLDLKFGYFDNSYNNTSVYTGVTFNRDYYVFGDLVISPSIGFMLATGYDDTDINAPVLAPIFHPAISFGHKTLRSTIGYIPYGEDRVVTFQTQIQF